MAIGKPAADSSVPVTYQIGGKSLIDLAKQALGGVPCVWGRYFTSASTSGVVEYRHLRENQALRDSNIRVAPIARQTKRVDGTQDEGSTDAAANAEDVILTFGGDYLQSEGGNFLVFLDVEGAPSLSAAYYRGWGQTLADHSRSFSGGRVSLIPCVYATRGDNDTWDAAAQAVSQGVPCGGSWVARWTSHGCSAPPNFDNAQVAPAIPLPFNVLLWQYSDDCYGGGGFDCDETNPGIDAQNELMTKCILPPDVSAAVR